MIAKLEAKLERSCMFYITNGQNTNGQMYGVRVEEATLPYVSTCTFLLSIVYCLRYITYTKSLLKHIR